MFDEVFGGGTRSGEAELSGLVVRHGPKSLLFFDDESVQEVWLPYSKIIDWKFTDSNDDGCLDVRDLELNDEITVTIPRWLAKKEGLVE